MKAAAQVNKPWGKLTKEDLKNIQLPPNEMKILEAIFNSKYSLDIDSPDNKGATSESGYLVDIVDDIYTEEYDDLEDLIVHEMIEAEMRLDDDYLHQMSELYCIPFEELKAARPLGEAKLQKQLEDALFISDTFEYASCMCLEKVGAGDDDD